MRGLESRRRLRQHVKRTGRRIQAKDDRAAKHRPVDANRSGEALRQYTSKVCREQIGWHRREDFVESELNSHELCRRFRGTVIQHVDERVEVELEQLEVIGKPLTDPSTGAG